MVGTAEGPAEAVMKTPLDLGERELETVGEVVTDPGSVVDGLGATGEGVAEGATDGAGGWLGAGIAEGLLLGAGAGAGAGAAGAPPPGAAEPQLPEGGDCLPPLSWTSGPGLGKVTSADSRVLQPLPMLAVKRPGRAEKAAARFLFSRLATSRLVLPPVMVTGAQFMYISRFPSWLNHVQAKMAVPGLASEGTVKS